ncbi:ParB N-terminal domain-containing protein [Bosea sp. ASV33]|uniref:ParB/RepB/Spo0J family partition protein n=1 Tax=Bosea sp. ASV33 TaxID=2795106 RepID=UPI0018EC8AB6|nr:ParB N-terminal domain-containing protein [Bosea sp. ASV33]
MVGAVSSGWRGVLSFAESIKAEGLLQPIGVTEGLELVFGERRLRAVRDILKRGTIDVRIVKVSSMVAGEMAENEVRKDFTPSERRSLRRSGDDAPDISICVDLCCIRLGGRGRCFMQGLEARRGSEPSSGPAQAETMAVVRRLSDPGRDSAAC